MVGTPPPVTTALPMVPLPRRPLDPSDEIRRWYENELGWPTAPAHIPVRLCVGPRFDVLDVPAEAGRAALRHLVPGSPVALQGSRMRLLVAAGSAEELPGVLDWLEWSTLPLDLTMIGEGGAMDAPLPPEPGRTVTPRPLCDPGSAVTTRLLGGPETPLREAGPPPATVPRPSGPEPVAATRLPSPPGAARVRELPPGPPHPPGRYGTVQGAALWVRPPEPGWEVEASLPTLSAMGGVRGAPDLVRVLNTVATHCHRLWLRRGCARPSAVPRARH
jgi:hypothetical protein